MRKKWSNSLVVLVLMVCTTTALTIDCAHELALCKAFIDTMADRTHEREAPADQHNFSHEKTEKHYVDRDSGDVHHHWSEKTLYTTSYPLSSEGNEYAYRTEEVEYYTHTIWGLGTSQRESVDAAQASDPSLCKPAYADNQQERYESLRDREDYGSGCNNDDGSTYHHSDTSSFKHNARVIVPRVLQPMYLCEQLRKPWTRWGIRRAVNDFKDKPWTYFQRQCMDTSQYEPWVLTALAKETFEPLFAAYELYQFPGYREFLRQLPYCHEFITDIQSQLASSCSFAALVQRLPGYEDHSFACIIQQFARQVESDRAQREQQEQELRARLEQMKKNFDAQYDELLAEQAEWQELLETYKAEGISNAQRLERRIHTLQEMNAGRIVYTEQRYIISYSASDLLKKMASDEGLYKLNYGNQLQQLLHQECLEGIERLAAIRSSTIVYPYRQGIAQCFDAARAYNQEGLTYNATIITDFCWTLLDYGLAIGQGAVAGVIGAVKDLAEHPVQTALCVVAGECVLAYQLSKILYQVSTVAYTMADIGITALTDPESATHKWDAYIAPVNRLIEAISAQQITVRDILKSGTQFIVQWKTQDKLLAGLASICSTAKEKALAFAQKNPLATPHEYAATPEGMVLKAMKDPHGKSIHKGGNCSKEQTLKDHQKQITVSDEHFVEQLRKKLDRSQNPAHSVTQFYYLNKDLLEAQYTSIAKCTKHGLQRLMERFTPEEFAAIIQTPDRVKKQYDGAYALIKSFGEKYGIITINPTTQRVITGINGLDIKQTVKLGKNYGWSLHE